MMRVLALFLLVSCASTKVIERKYTEADFKAPQLVKFSKSNDYYLTTNPSSFGDEAIDEASDKEKLDPLGQIFYLCHQGKLDEGLSRSMTHFAVYQKHPGYWNAVGSCYLGKRQYRKAILYFNKAIEINKDYAPAINNLGVTYERKGLEQKSIVAYTSAYKKNRFSQVPRFNLALILLKHGLVDKSLDHFRGLVRSDPQNPEVNIGVANAYFLSGNEKGAVEYFSRLPESYHKRADVGINYALGLASLGRKQVAREVIGRVEAHNNKQSDMLNKAKSYIAGR